jgi:hypothetical protein
MNKDINVTGKSRSSMICKGISPNNRIFDIIIMNSHLLIQLIQIFRRTPPMPEYKEPDALRTFRVDAQGHSRPSSISMLPGDGTFHFMSTS